MSITLVRYVSCIRPPAKAVVKSEPAVSGIAPGFFVAEYDGRRNQLIRQRVD